MFGWAGTILRVDLSSRKIIKQDLKESLAFCFLGGAGINAKILYDEVRPGVDPFDPENRLIYGAGPLSGTLAPSSGRLAITSKGPFTFAFSDSNSGGHFAPELKFAGYDVVVFRGRADKPCYIWIDDENVELRDASSLWGTDVWEADELIKEELGDSDVKTSIIGPPGERLVRYAIPVNDRTRAPGWGGQGGVLGSKNLKAVVVRGTKGVQIADPEAFEKVCTESRNSIRKSPMMKTYGIYGKPWLNELYNNVLKMNPTKNYSESRVPLESFPRMHHENYLKLVVKPKGCFNCPMHCGHYLRVDSGPFAGTEGEGYEYNQIVDVQMMGIYDLSFALVWSNETNKLGLDCDGTAFAIAWAMECYDKGILTRKDLDDIDLTWGNKEAVLQMLKKIAYREGVGSMLGEGVQIASKRIGKGSEKFAYHVKGGRIEVDPRVGWANALSHAVSTRGSDHLKGLPTSGAFGIWTGKDYDWTDDTRITYQAEAVIFSEHLHALIDSIGLCKNDSWSQCVEGPGPKEFAEMLTAATGRNFTPNELLTVGERIINVERLFNAREGLTRKDDTFPEKFFREHAGRIRLEKKKFEGLKDQYYTLRGWDVATGNPTKEKLNELGLGFSAKDLER